jgi:hypothetical protein
MAKTEKKETDLEKRKRETDEANARLEKESDEHLSKHREHLEEKAQNEAKKESN